MSRGLYVLTVKAFITRHTLTAPPLRLLVVPDRQRPKELAVKYSLSPPYIAGNYFPGERGSRYLSLDLLDLHFMLYGFNNLGTLKNEYMLYCNRNSHASISAMLLFHKIFPFLFRSMLLVLVYFSYRNYLHVSLLYANIRKFSLRQASFLHC